MWNDVSRICLKACSLAATCFAMLSQISVNLHCQLNYSYKDWCAHLWRFRTVFVLPKTWLTADKLHGAVASPTSLECLGISTEGWCGDIDGIIRSSFQPKELNTEALDINNCMLRAELTQKFVPPNKLFCVQMRNSFSKEILFADCYKCMQWALNDQIMVQLYLKEEVIRTCWHFTFLQTCGSDRLPVESCLSLKTLAFKVAGTLSDFMASLDIFQSCLFSSLKKFNWHHFVELVMFTVISDLNPPHSAAAFLSVCTTADRTRTVWQHHAWGHGNLPVNVTSVWVNLHKLDFFCMPSSECFSVTSMTM